MSVYVWQGRDQRGIAISGELEAASEEAVASHLMANNLIPIAIKPQVNKKSSAPKKALWSKKKVKMGHIIFFCRQLHTLLRAGVPIFSACESLKQSNQNTPLGPVIGDLMEALNSGVDFTGALRRQASVFPPLMISFIEMGESSGNLPEMLKQISLYMEQEQETRNRIKQAMRYPMIVIGAITIAMTIINVVVIPAFANVFDKFGSELPWQTRILLACSNFMVNYWYVIAFAVIASGYFIQRHLRTTQGKLMWDRVKLRLPLLGTVLKAATMSRFARAMALNVKAGMPWNRAMNLVGQAVDNSYVQRHIDVMRDGIENGKSLTATAGATGLFPPLVLQMLAIGEQSGAVDELMEEVAGYYEREVEYGLKTLTGAIEPILTVAIGIMVLILALGVFMPMWKLASVALKK